jgi:hypothetical protein
MFCKKLCCDITIRLVTIKFQSCIPYSVTLCTFAFHVKLAIVHKVLRTGSCYDFVVLLHCKLTPVLRGRTVYWIFTGWDGDSVLSELCPQWKNAFITCIMRVKRWTPVWSTCIFQMRSLRLLYLTQWFPKCGARAKLFYSLKIHKKHKYNYKNLVLLDDLLSKIRLFMFHIQHFMCFSRGSGGKLKQNLEGGRKM